MCIYIYIYTYICICLPARPGLGQAGDQGTASGKYFNALIMIMIIIVIIILLLIIIKIIMTI